MTMKFAPSVSLNCPGGVGEVLGVYAHLLLLRILGNTNKWEFSKLPLKLGFTKHLPVHPPPPLLTGQSSAARPKEATIQNRDMISDRWRSWRCAGPAIFRVSSHQEKTNLVPWSSLFLFGYKRRKTTPPKKKQGLCLCRNPKFPGDGREQIFPENAQNLCKELFAKNARKSTTTYIRSGKTDPVQFKGVFKQGPFCL